MLLPESSIARKIVMALSGQVLVIFIIFHIAGNSTIFFHALNAYVVALLSMSIFVWGGRIVLTIAFVLHVWYGTVLKLENYAAKPQRHTVINYRKATFAGRYQMWMGVIIAVSSSITFFNSPSRSP